MNTTKQKSSSLRKKIKEKKAVRKEKAQVTLPNEDSFTGEFFYHENKATYLMKEPIGTDLLERNEEMKS